MKLKFLLLASFLCLFANAQEDQSVKENATKAVTDRFPSTRLFDVQYEQYLPTDFDSELFDVPFEKGEIQNHSRLSVSANLPLIMKAKWNITTSLRYRYETFDLNNVESRTDNTIPSYDKTQDFHYLSGSLNFTYFSMLFKKPFIYNASVIVDGNEKDAERIKGFFGATIILKKTERTTLGVGLVIFVDPTSPVPAAPTFLWEHQFENSPWTMDLILPQRLLFKRNLFRDGRLSLGSELGGDGFYINNSTPGFAKVYDYRVLEVKSGLIYEHSFSKSLIGTFRAGYSNVFNSRISERGEKTSDYIFSSKQDGTAYFSLGFSFNPTFKKNK